MATYEFALINNHEEGKLFFENLQHTLSSHCRGKNKGKLRVKKIRSIDGNAVLEAQKALEYAETEPFCDYSNVFRNEDDRLVITFIPYQAVTCNLGV